MAAAVEKQLSTASEEYDDEALDPRVQVELEKLNKASEDINKLELELDEARAGFRQALSESTQRLNALSKKLGSCIEKARPYYDARMKAKEAQIETQNVALRFERACSQQMAAKEMVYLAEQGFFKKGQPFDPAWQEMLNHATMKVNDAERERLECEIAHQVTAQLFNESEQRVKQLQKELKRNITKSRPYFEQKAKFNQTMEEQKKRVSHLEQTVTEAKAMYSEALANLERISDEIHRQRHEAQLRKEMGSRGAGVGAEQPAPPPAHDGHPPLGAASRHVCVSRTNSQTQTEDKERGADTPDPTKRASASRLSATSTHPLASTPPDSLPPSLPPSGPSRERQHLSVVEVDTEAVSETLSSAGLLTPGSAPSSALTTALTSPDLEPAPAPAVGSRLAGVRAPTQAEEQEEEEQEEQGDGGRREQEEEEQETEGQSAEESTRANMEVMETLQKAKNFKSTFLRPNRSRDDLLSAGGATGGAWDEASDNESVPGSMASVSVLDDDQIESLMLETGDFVNFLSQQEEPPGGVTGSGPGRGGAAAADRAKSLTLPAKLSYLQNYMHFKPQFVASEAEIDGRPDVTCTDKEVDPVTKEGNISRSSQPPPTPQTAATETTEKGGLMADGECGRPPCRAAGAALSRAYSGEEETEFQRVYRELSAFEKLMRSSSSSTEEAPSVGNGRSRTPRSEEGDASVHITVTDVETDPGCKALPRQDNSQKVRGSAARGQQQQQPAEARGVKSSKRELVLDPLGVMAAVHGVPTDGAGRAAPERGSSSASASASSSSSSGVRGRAERFV